mmetsp:Transcript_36064/g.56307  ORF Transcript_36064/g.56307 Transcript_36064/m.56307 type:complete len:120 (-) Transcript_36064:80-439(-)
MDDPKLAIEHYNQAIKLRESRSEILDPQAHTRHLQLIKSKLARAKAQVLEASGEDGDEGDGGGDFLWRSHGLGVNDSDNEMQPLEELDQSPSTYDDYGMSYYKELANNAMSRALTMLMS